MAAQRASKVRAALLRKCGTLALSLCPCGAQPLSGAMLVLVHVSSMKTRCQSALNIDP